MSDKNTDKELSLDELKDVSGGMTNREDSAMAKKKSKSIPEDGILSSGDAADIHAPTPLSAVSHGRYQGGT